MSDNQNQSISNMDRELAAVAAGDKNLYYIEGDLLGTDREATVDPSHPTTLGFMRMAEGIIPTLQKILN